MKVEVLCNNIFLDGSFRYQGEVVDISKEDFNAVEQLDANAGRECRLKAKRTRRTKAEIEADGNDS